MCDLRFLIFDDKGSIVPELNAQSRPEFFLSKMPFSKIVCRCPMGIQGVTCNNHQEI